MANPYDQFDATSEAKDLATSFAVGSNQLLKMAGDVYGLTTGNMDNVVSRQGQENIDYLQRGKSEKLRQAEIRRKAAVDMEEGTLDKALAYTRETFTDPRLFLSTTAESVPSLVGAGGIGAGARAAAGKLLAKKGAETATKIGVGAAVGAGAGMQGTSVGAEQYAEVVDILQKMPEEQALQVPQIARLMTEKGATLEEAKTALALDLARSTGALASLASVGTQLLPGGRTIEKALVGGAGKKIAGTALAGAAMGALGEGVQEAVEEGSGAGLKNLLARAVEPERELTKGVGEAMGAGFSGAAPLGSAAGAASRPSRPVPVGETTAGKSGEPLASDATTSEPRTSITDTPDLSLEGAGEMSTREMGSVLSARDSAARGFTPDPSDIATVEGVRRPQVEVSEEATKAAIVPVQEALDEWRNQNPNVRLNVTVVNDPNLRNTRNYGIRGYFDPNTGEVVINSAFTKPFEVESVVNHEWSHHTLASDEGRTALAEFATREIPATELSDLAKRYPNADNLTLVEEWIARNQEKSPGVFARIVAKIREWLDGKLGIRMTNEEAARVMLRTLRERGAPVAEEGGEMRQSTTDQPVGEPEPVKREPGRSGMMASPSVVDINYDRAKRNLTSSDQARFRSDVEGFAPEATVYNAVGDWADGAENSVAAVFKDVRSSEELRQLAANAGLTGDQKAALWWRVDESGPDAIHQVTWPKAITMDEARQAMIDAGLENRTLIQTRDGVMGFVFDQGQQNLSKIDKLYESPTNPSTHSSPATGEFVGSWSTRIEGKRAYRNVLGLPTKTPEGEGVSGLGVRGRGDSEAEPERASVLAKQPIRESLTDEPVERVPEEGDPDYEEIEDTGSALGVAANVRERDDLSPTSALNTLYAKKSAVPVPTTGKRTNGQVAEQLRQAAIAYWGKELSSSNLTEEDIARLVDNGVEEVLAGLKASNHAGNWYTTAIRKAMAIAGVLHPELTDDALAQKAGFKDAHTAEVGLAAAMAITSQNLNVEKNTEYANDQFNILKKTGRFDPSKVYGSKAEAISGNLELANVLLDKVGWDGMEGFLNREYTLKELNDVASQLLGQKISITGKVDDVVNGSAIFGPKIGGGFFQNLRGNFNPVTVDLWMRRTWGRWTGNVLPDPLDAKRLARMIDGMRESGIQLPEELRSIRTITAKKGRKVPTLSDATAERVLSDPQAVTAAYDFAALHEARWNKIYGEVRQNITPEQAEAIRNGSLSLEELNRQQQKSLRQKRDAWQDLEDRPSISTKEGKAAQKELFAAMDAEAGRTAILTNEELSDNKPEWAKSARVIKTLLKPIDVPSDIDRRAIVDVVNRIRNELDRQGVSATNADIQAILWYPEKDLWAKLAGKKESNLKNSYDEEFLRVAESQGLGDQARSASAKVRD